MWVLFAEPLVSLQTVLVLESIVTKRAGHMLKLSMFTLNVSFDVMLYLGRVIAQGAVPSTLGFYHFGLH